MRPIYEIAEEIRKVWRPMYFGAKPYVEAMMCLTTVDDAYICESGDSIVRYFLANAQTWRGEDARRIKKELKSLLK